MTKRTYGILAGVLGSALGAWWYSRRRSGSSASENDRGVTIYHNAPTAAPISAEGII
jgi:hypothetical protein